MQSSGEDKLDSSKKKLKALCLAHSGDSIGEVGWSQILRPLGVMASIYLYLILNVVESIGEFKSMKAVTLDFLNFETLGCS